MINRRVQKFLDVQSIIQLLAPNIKIIVKVTNKSISVILRKIIEDSLGRQGFQKLTKLFFTGKSLKKQLSIIIIKMFQFVIYCYMILAKVEPKMIGKFQ